MSKRFFEHQQTARYFELLNWRNTLVRIFLMSLMATCSMLAMNQIVLANLAQFGNEWHELTNLIKWFVTIAPMISAIGCISILWIPVVLTQIHSEKTYVDFDNLPS